MDYYFDIDHYIPDYVDMDDEGWGCAVDEIRD